MKGKWPYYGVMNFLEYCLQCRTMEMFQRQQLQLKLHSLIQMKMNSATLNIWKEKIHDQKMEGGSSQKEQPAGIKRGGKMQKLTAVDIAKQNLDSLREIGNEWRRSWVRISVTILIEQKRHRLLSLSLYIYIYTQGVPGGMCQTSGGCSLC